MGRRRRNRLVAAVLHAPLVAAELDLSELKFDKRSAYFDISASLEHCADGGKNSGLRPEDAAAAEFACSLGCQPHEKMLHEAFEPWWDHKIDYHSVQEVCKMVISRQARVESAYLGAISQGRVLYKCCGDCNTVELLQSEKAEAAGVPLTDTMLAMTLISEMVQKGHLTDMYFSFNTGDQPFTDKVYWSPVPQFSWVAGPGYWTIPLPNPYHLKAHFKNRLGDSPNPTQTHIPWREKTAKVFWRGSLSAPDNYNLHNMQTLPRVRLMLLAKEHPELFDVGITAIDEELWHKYPEAEVRKFLQTLPGKVHHERFDAVLPHFKYVINISAVLSSWRLVELLASGSLLLLQDDSSKEVIYDWLTPWEHFVPVSNNLSDLVSKIQWLEAHPEQAEAIARRGFLQFQNRVRRGDTYCYLWQAFRTLANMTKSIKLPPPEELIHKHGWTQVDHAKVAELIPEHEPLSRLMGQRSAEL